MKKIMIWMLILAMVLCGCGKQEKPTETTTQTQTANGDPTIPEAPVQPYSELYVADSAVELATEGAVKEYLLEGEECVGVMPFAEGILILSYDDAMVLTYIQPDGTRAEKKLKDLFLLSEELTFIDDDRLAYYDSQSRSMVLLNDKLEQIDSVTMPETIVDDPAVTSDWGKIYYLTEDELRYVDVETGIDRLLKQMNFPTQTVQKVHFGDTLLECSVVEDSFQTMMISTQNGELVYATESYPSLDTDGDKFFATCFDNDILQYLFGTRGEKPNCLTPQGDLHFGSAKLQCAVTCQESEEGIQLYYYDLTAGVCSAAVELPLEFVPQSVSVDDTWVWFVAMGDDYELGLYCWDITMSQTGDTTSCVGPYYTAESPDEEGLRQIAIQANQLGQQYGVRIRVYEDALKVEPWDYTFEAEYLVPVYQRYLAELERALSQYPDGFLRKVGTTSANGKITISLVRQAYGDNGMGSLDTADGVHFYNDSNVYIALVTGDRLVPTLYHELFHAIDTYVLNNCNIYDQWEQLNPEGFEYDNDYVANQFREDHQYLEDDRWFIDMYSMSFAKEDRARIMEYAMEYGNEEYFESNHMQKKLTTLCLGIRTAFGLKSYSGILPWEQYLG